MSLSSEQGIISCVFHADNAVSTSLSSGCTPSWFSHDDTKAIWEWAVKRFSENKPCDMLSCSHAIAAGLLPAEPKWLHDCYMNASDTALGGYLYDTKNDWMRTLAGETIGNAVESLVESQNVVEDVLGLSDRLQKIVQDEVVSTEALHVTADRLITSWNAPDTKKQLKWPLPRLEDGIGCVTDELVFLAASESVGKTAYALQWANFLAWQGHTVSIRSLESKQDKLVQRLISLIGEVNTWQLRRGHGTPADKERAKKACERIKEIEGKIRICDAPANMDQLTAWGRLEKQKGSEMLIIDNMKHIRPNQKYNSPVEQFRDISQRLKWMRDDVGLPLVILHHSTVEGDVSWSKDIRRDTDVLIIMSIDADASTEPGPHNGWCGKTIVKFDVQKNREGARGFAVTQRFVGSFQRFEEVDMGPTAKESDI